MSKARDIADSTKTLDVDGGTIKLDGNYPVGTGNVALGDTALDSNVSGAQNTAIGDSALTANTSGSINVAVGYNAGSAVTTGVFNTIIGGNAGDALTDADFNVAVGTFALTDDTLGSRSTALGYGTLSTQNFTSATNSFNTAVGYFAGNTVTTGTNNTLIGSLAGYLMTTGSKNTILGSYNGNQGGLDIRTSSSNIVLSDGDGNPRMHINSSGNVGIGTSSPSVLLDLESASPIIRLTDSDASGTPECQISGAGGDLIFDADRDNEKASSLMLFKVDGSERMRIDSSGNVGIGTSSPVAPIEISKSGTGEYSTLALTNSGASGRRYIIGLGGSTTNAAFANKLYFYDNTATTTRMAIDSSGNLLVGQSSSTAVGAGNTTTGFSIRGDGGLYASRSSGPTITANANASGDIIKLYKSGSTVGSIGAFGNSGVYIAAPTSGGSALIFNDNAPIIYPAKNNSGTIAVADNAIDLGASGVRFDDIYATNGTIQTSDRNEKQDIEVLTSAETAVAVACKGLLRKFRWIDSVTEKGDDARIHFGIIAQDLQDAFTAQGLDAGRYAMFISSTWWETQTDVPAVVAVDEVLDEDGNVVTEAVEAKDAYTRTDTFDTLAEAPEGATERTRLGVRYPELLAFIIAAI